MSKRQSYALMGASAVLFILALFGAGCASAIKDVKIAENATGETVILGYRALVEYDQTESAMLLAQARNGDALGAIKTMDSYHVMRTTAFKALDAASSLLDATDKLVDAVAAGIEKPSALIGQVPKLIQAGLDVREALNALGVKF